MESGLPRWWGTAVEEQLPRSHADSSSPPLVVPVWLHHRVKEVCTEVHYGYNISAQYDQTQYICQCPWCEGQQTEHRSDLLHTCIITALASASCIWKSGKSVYE